MFYCFLVGCNFKGCCSRRKKLPLADLLNTRKLQRKASWFFDKTISYNICSNSASYVDCFHVGCVDVLKLTYFKCELFILIYVKTGLTRKLFGENSFTESRSKSFWQIKIWSISKISSFALWWSSWSRIEMSAFTLSSNSVGNRRRAVLTPLSTNAYFWLIEICSSFRRIFPFPIVPCRSSTENSCLTANDQRNQTKKMIQFTTQSLRSIQIKSKPTFNVRVSHTN